MQAPINPAPTPAAAAKRRFIDEVEISNFKFFPAHGAENKPIKIDGKHLLVYGENGSGKSSFYWALYTLLECANKLNNTQIEKYFEYDGDESLLNINAIRQAAPNEMKAENAYVKIRLKNDANADYIISYDDVAIRTKLEPQISNFASDFINYRVLYSAFNYAHSEEVDLYHHFKYTVFPYVKFDDPCKIWIKNEGTGNWDEAIIQEVNPIIQFLENGAFYTVNAKNKKVYSLTKDQVKEVKNSLKKIKETLHKLITHINTKGNVVLQNLGYSNLDFFVEDVVETKESVGEVSYTAPKINILLKNKTYEGQVNKVHRIHSFFNEAKLTAVSLAIRLAVLEKKPDDAQVKILVLDDFMISLDMNNRTKVIDYVFNNYLSKYQTFILTHDKSLFDFIQLKINQWDKKGNWEIKEMYFGSTNKPVIIEENLDLIQRADAYFKAFDYYSAGNNIRKAIEKKLEELLPETVRITTRDLDHEIRQLFEYYDDNGCSEFIPDQLRNELLQYKDIVFNPSSHFDLKSPLYKVEIEKAFHIYNILNSLPKLTVHLLAGMRASLFYTNAALNYSAEYVLRENLYAVTVPGQPARLSDPKHKLVTYSLNGIPFLANPQTGVIKTAEQIAAAQNEEIKMSVRIEKITHFINPPHPINLGSFTLANGTSLQQLIENI
jgi:energy-coupling factor transporter ATP-binding protein EcfA2